MIKSLFVLLNTLALIACVSQYEKDIASFQCPTALTEMQVEAFTGDYFEEAREAQKLYHRNPKAEPEDRDIRNLERAYNIYIEHAENNNPIAQHLIAHLHGFYNFGESPSKQMEHWYRKSAQNGLVASQYVLGSLYTIGKGEIHNDELGILWYECAASNGSKAASEYLKSINGQIEQS